MDALNDRRARPPRALFACGLVAAAGVALVARAMGAGLPFGGYHGFNEAFYALHARADLGRSLWDAVLAPGDFMNPPLFTMVESLVFRLCGVSEAVARGVSIAASALSVVYVGLIGNALYSARTGIAAAWLAALIPGFVLAGRNAQIEALFVLLMLAALFHAWRGRERRSTLEAAIAGVLLGLSILAKLPGVLLVPVLPWAEISANGDRSGRWRRLGACMTAALAVAAPWFVVQLVRNPGALLEATAARVSGGEAGFAELPNVELLRVLVVEVWAMLSPVGALLGVAGVALLAARRRAMDVVVLAAGAMFLVFFLFFHKHTYYLVPVVPFAALAAGEVIAAIRGAVARAAALGAVVVVLGFYAFLMLGGHKLGRTELATLLKRIRDDPRITIEQSRSFSGSYGTIVDYYLPRASKRSDPVDRLPPGTIVVGYTKQGLMGVEGALYVPAEVVGLTLFGVTFYVMPPNTHFFATGGIRMERFPGAAAFGVGRIPLDEGVMALDPRYVNVAGYDPGR